jgi:hypothetical protein
MTLPFYPTTWAEKAVINGGKYIINESLKKMTKR